MKTTDIVLISPPSRAINHYRPPIGLIYLGGFMLHHGYTVKIIDIALDKVVRDQSFFDNLNHNLEIIEKRIIKQYKKILSPIVGISCYTPEYQEVLKLARKIKTINPKCKIIVGGIHPTLYPNELLLEPNSPVDYEVVGEGEETLLELSHHILKNPHNSRNYIKGIAYKNKAGDVIKTKYRPVKDNLDDISFPAHHLVDMSYYTNASPYSIRGCFLRSAYVLATRGCPSQCTFCVAKKLKQYNGGGRYTRTRSAQNLYKEIKGLKSKYKIDSFYFIDDLFTINRANVIKFCHLLKEKRINLLWGCSSKVSTLNEEILKEMAESGCIQIDLGIERGSNSALLKINKGITVKDIKKIVRLCHKYHIRVFSNFLANLPNETNKDLKDIDNLASLLKSEINSFNIFTPYPGTQIHDDYKIHFTKKEYQILFRPDQYLYHPKYIYRLKFSKHNTDLISWASEMSKKHNQVINNLRFHLSKRYLKTIFFSKQKLNYLFQLKELVLEIFNQLK